MREHGPAVSRRGRSLDMMFLRMQSVARRHVVFLSAVALGGFVIGFRAFGVGRSFDVFYDEILYQELGGSVLQGTLPTVDGRLFFLHPPLFFYMAAAWQLLTGSSSDVILSVYQDRLLNCFMSGISASLLFIITSRLASKRAGILAITLFALDPYAARINGKVLLETSTMMWVLAGYALLLPLLTVEESWAKGRAALAGCAFGLAILTKDMAWLVTIPPLWFGVYRLRVPWRLAAFVTCVAGIPYLIYGLLLFALGHFDEFLTQKTSGVGRMLGFIQISGFNQSGAPDLVPQLVRQLADYGTTYVVLAGGMVAAFLAWRHGPVQVQYVSTFYFCSCTTLAYLSVQGALEEQFLYFLLVPSILMISLVLPTVAARRRPLQVSIVLLLTIFIVNGVTYIRWHAVRDDGFAQVRAFMLAHVPPKAPVIVLDQTGRYVLRNDFRVGTWTEPAQRRKVGVRYMVVPWREVAQGYTVIDTGIDAVTVRSLTADAKRMFFVKSRSYGEVALYKIPLPRGPAAAAPNRITFRAPSARREFSRQIELSDDGRPTRPARGRPLSAGGGRVCRLHPPSVAGSLGLSRSSKGPRAVSVLGPRLGRLGGDLTPITTGADGRGTKPYFAPVLALIARRGRWLGPDAQFVCDAITIAVAPRASGASKASSFTHYPRLVLHRGIRFPCSITAYRHTHATELFDTTFPVPLETTKLPALTARLPVQVT